MNIEGLNSSIVVEFDDGSNLEVQFCRNLKFEKLDHQFSGVHELVVDYREFDKIKHIYFRVINRGQHMTKT